MFNTQGLKRLLVLAMWSAQLAVAQSTTSITGPSVYHPPPSAHIQLADFDQFSMIEREMQYLISKQGNHKTTNHFCVVGYRHRDREITSIVIWKNNKWLILWDGGDPVAAKEEFRYASSLFSSKSFDLKTGLVEKMEYGGTGLIVRADAEGTIADCEKNGKQYTIAPFTVPDDEEPWAP